MTPSPASASFSNSFDPVADHPSVGVTSVSEEVGTKEEPGTKAWSRSVRAKARGLARDIESYCMALGELLYRVYDTPIDGDPRNAAVFKSWGYASFSDYAEQELGLHRKKADQLRGIWYRIEVELSSLDRQVKDNLFSLGFSKLREIKRVLNMDNAKWWAERAPTMNYQTVVATVKKITDERENERIAREIRAGGDPVKRSNDLDRDKDWHLHPVEDPGPRSEDYWAPPEMEEQFNKRFVFNAEQLETVKLALQRAAELSGSKASGKNISLICLDFLSNNDFSSVKMEQRLRFVAKMENLLGLRLVAVDPTMNEVVYGLATLKDVAGDEGEQALAEGDDDADGESEHGG